MRKLTITLASAAVLAMAPAIAGGDAANAGGKDIARGLLGGLVAGAIIGTIVQSGQYHCHAGYGCHSHGYAGPGHYHDAYGNIIYPGPAYAAPPPPPPPPAYGQYPQAHYDWCSAKYRSYDPGSNTFQPYGNVPRRPCISPYM